MSISCPLTRPPACALTPDWLEQSHLRLFAYPSSAQTLKPNKATCSWDESWPPPAWSSYPAVQEPGGTTARSHPRNVTAPVPLSGMTQLGSQA